MTSFIKVVLEKQQILVLTSSVTGLRSKIQKYAINNAPENLDKQGQFGELLIEAAKPISGDKSDPILCPYFP